MQRKLQSDWGCSETSGHESRFSVLHWSYHIYEGTHVWKQMLCAHCLSLTVNDCFSWPSLSHSFAFCPSIMLCWSMAIIRRSILFQYVFSTVHCHGHLSESAFLLQWKEMKTCICFINLFFGKPRASAERWVDCLLTVSALPVRINFHVSWVPRHFAWGLAPRCWESQISDWHRLRGEPRLCVIQRWRSSNWGGCLEWPSKVFSSSFLLCCYRFLKHLQY